jgi:hydroxymethylpyrimidine/phosphomethylpyrimidine kinase
MKPIDPSIQTVRAILTIAGSDCSAGAGLQADLKTFQHFGLHGLTAVTCIVSETANIVRRVDSVDSAMLQDQILLMLDSFPLTVVKTGMLGSAKHVSCVAEIFKNHPDIKLVIDPVMIASTGDSLLEPEAIATYREKLLPMAYVITPNLPEAETLLGKSIASLKAMSDAAQQLSEVYGCAVLLKGGHLQSQDCSDILFDGKTEHLFTSPRLDVKASHGTGCTLAAAIAANLAKGQDLPSAVSSAKEYLNDCLKNSYSFVNRSNEVISALNQGTQMNNWR